MTDPKNTKLIPLTQGKFTVVDAEDYEWLNQWKWFSHSMGYAKRNRYVGIIDGKKKQENIFMHRLILNPPLGMYTDHINGDKLDNRRCNLRACSHRENRQNKGQQKNNKSSKYKGVTFNAACSKNGSVSV